MLGLDLFSHTVAGKLSSALRRFTSVFEMGTGGSTSLKRPSTLILPSINWFDNYLYNKLKYNYAGSSNGRNDGSEPSNRGSNPRPATKLCSIASPHPTRFRLNCLARTIHQRWIKKRKNF